MIQRVRASATLNKAFDKGLITIDNEYKIVFSSKIKKFSKDAFYEVELGRFENRQIILPIKFRPKDEFLQYHYDVVFQK